MVFVWAHHLISSIREVWALLHLLPICRSAHKGKFFSIILPSYQASMRASLPGCKYILEQTVWDWRTMFYSCLGLRDSQDLETNYGYSIMNKWCTLCIYELFLIIHSLARELCCLCSLQWVSLFRPVSLMPTQRTLHWVACPTSLMD